MHANPIFSMALPKDFILAELNLKETLQQNNQKLLQKIKHQDANFYFQEKIIKDLEKLRPLIQEQGSLKINESKGINLGQIFKNFPLRQRNESLVNLDDEDIKLREILLQVVEISSFYQQSEKIFWEQEANSLVGLGIL